MYPFLDDFDPTVLVRGIANRTCRGRCTWSDTLLWCMLDECPHYEVVGCSFVEEEVPGTDL